MNVETHQSCLDMSETMYQVVKSYLWMCIECKPCSICSKLDEEDKMLFCDRCDRGYHTFCVGLNRLPSGRWICQKFCAATSDQQNSIMLNFSCLNSSDDNSNSITNCKNSISEKSNSCVNCGCFMNSGEKNTSRITRRKKNAPICDICRSNESKKFKVEVQAE
uniref:PHD-type domain-containing protein n=1 Tax=Romanomermis culicivorax TaxID=13658 RepID=A0A915IZY6_ROMCU